MLAWFQGTPKTEQVGLQPKPSLMMCPVNWLSSLPLQLIHILTKDGLPGPPYVWFLVFLCFCTFGFCLTCLAHGLFYLMLIKLHLCNYYGYLTVVKKNGSPLNLAHAFDWVFIERLYDGLSNSCMWMFCFIDNCCCFLQDWGKMYSNNLWIKLWHAELSWQK